MRNVLEERPDIKREALERTRYLMDRFVRDYRVILVSGDQAVVIGDHDTYEVTRLGQRWSCTCPWGRYKAHIKNCSQSWP